MIAIRMRKSFWDTKQSRNCVLLKDSAILCMHACSVGECGHYNNTARSFILLLIRAVLCHVDIMMATLLQYLI